MKIWITGISGFLGSHLADALIADGHEVFGNDNMICGTDGNSPVGYLKEDCRDYDAMLVAFKDFKPDVVVHAAATAHEGLSSFSPSFITKNIYEASVSVFSAAIESGVERIVYMSSMSRYGNGGNYNSPPFKEDYRTFPVDPYAVAKIAAEDTLKILCDTHDVKWTIAVPHNIIGPRQRSVDPYRNVAAIMINRCKQGKAPIVYGDGSQTRCFSPVKDCISSIVRMVHGASDGEIVNIGPDSGEISILELAKKVINLCADDTMIEYFPDRPNEVKHAYCSSEKARRLLGYEPKQSIDDCLKEMVEYIKPMPFVYDFPLEIVTDRTPKTWKDKLI